MITFPFNETVYVGKLAEIAGGIQDKPRNKREILLKNMHLGRSWEHNNLIFIRFSLDKNKSKFVTYVISKN